MRLVAEAVSPFEIDLSWKDTSDNEDGFQVDISTDGTTFLARTTVQANTEKYMDVGLTEGTPYWYRVRSYNTSGSSSYSNIAHAVTFLRAPTGLRAVAVSFSQMVLSWEDNSDKEDGFEVWRSADGITYMPVGTVLTNTTAFTDTGLNDGSVYSYWVRAYSFAAKSFYSNVASSSTLLAPPTGLKAMAVGFSDIALFWQDNSCVEIGYRIERSTDGTNFIQITTVPANTATFTDTGLEKGTRYWYRVQAYYSGGGSEYSNVASAFTPPWSKTYGGSGWDEAVSAQQTTDGGYIVAGTTSSFGAGGQDFWVLKLSVDGAVEWQRAFGGPGSDSAASIQQTSDGGYIVAGYTDSSGAGLRDVWMLKLSGEGTVEWQKAYGGPGSDSAASIQQTGDGGYIVAGYTGSFGAVKGDYWVLKLNGDGSVAWEKTYGGGWNDLASSIQQTSDGGYIVAGTADSFPQVWVLKLNADGTVAWQKAYAELSYFYAYFVRETNDGGYIVSGYGSGWSDAMVIKLNADGTTAWQKGYGGTGYERAFSVQQISNGDYILAGSTRTPSGALPDLWVFGLESDGTIHFNPSSGMSSKDIFLWIHDTYVTGSNTSANVFTTSVTPVETNATVTDTNATIKQQAP